MAIATAGSSLRALQYAVGQSCKATDSYVDLGLFPQIMEVITDQLATALRKSCTSSGVEV